MEEVPYRRSYLPPELLDRDWIVARLDAGATVSDIAKETGIRRQRVQQVMNTFGLYSIRAPRKLLDAEWLAEQWPARSGADIAAELGTTSSTVYKYLRQAGLFTSTR